MKGEVVLFMPNANTNLVSIQIRPTNTANSTTRTQVARSPRANSNVKDYHSNSSARNSKSDFGAELDKVNSQINQAQQKSDEVQAAAETAAESENIDAIVKASHQGQNKNQQQDAPQEKILSSPNTENSLPVTKNVIAENVIGNVVTEIISPTIQPQVQVEVPIDVLKDVPQNISPTIDAVIVTENITPQVNQTAAVEIPIDAVKDIPVSAENLAPQVSTDIPTENLVNVVKADDANEEIPDVMENILPLATSADMAFYFTSNTEQLLPTSVPVEVDKPNLMSIMPQAQDNKSQSMLDLLSGKTWQSVKSNETVTENLPQQNINLQSLEPQLNQSAPNQNFFPIQPQFNSRPLNIQPTVQAQPTLQATVQTEIQPTLNQNQSPLQVQTPLNLQPNLNQVTLQTATPTDFQPTLQTVQNDFQPNLNQNQIPLQNFTQNDFQPTLNQNQIPLQNFTQNDFQPTLNQNQIPLQNLTQDNSQSTLNQAPLQNLTPVDFQQTLNQPTLQAQPQVQQQQFGGEIQPQINSLQPQVDSKMVNRQTVNEFLGVPLQVEESQPSTPIIPLQSTPQQFEQNQQFTRNFQQNFSQMTSNVETPSQEQVATTGQENFLGNVAAVNNTTQNQPTAQVQAPEMMQAPREDFNVPAQIVEQARMIRTATNTEMVINLKPEHLGQLTLRVSVSTSGAVNASFYSDNAQVRAIIENSVVQLKQELNDQGIKVDNVEVYAGLNEGGLLNGQGQQAWQQNQQRSHRGTINLDAVEDEVDALNPVNESTSADGGVDYKV